MFVNVSYIDKLPKELIDILYDYLPYTITRLLCRKTNEMIKAEKNTPTGCAHSIHIAIQRFHWRWIRKCEHKQISRRSYPLNKNGLSCFFEEDNIHWRNKREITFINDTLQFHKKWSGPPIIYDSYYCHLRRFPRGIHNGSD